MNPFATIAGFFASLPVTRSARPDRQVDGRAGPGLAGAWDARGAEPTLARRALADRPSSGWRWWRFLSGVPPIVTIALCPESSL